MHPNHLFHAALICSICLFTGYAAAQAGSAPGTLYQQEGTTADGPSSINAAGQGPVEPAGSGDNWKWQSGGGAWSAVYAGEDGWLTADGSRQSLEIEADIELYYSISVSNNKIYFHFGNIYNASEEDRTAYINTSLASNNGQWVGLDFSGTGKMPGNFERLPPFGGGDYTGRIFSLMHSDRTVDMQQHKDMDGEIKLNDGMSPDFKAPDYYGSDSQGLIHETLWWRINNGMPGSYQLTWRLRLLPEAHQPDGDYYIDPGVVSAPAL